MTDISTDGEDRTLRNNLIGGAVIAMVLIAAIGGWAATTELSGAVTASGSVVVDSSVKKVQHLTGGIVGALLVREGDHVRAGDSWCGSTRLRCGQAWRFTPKASMRCGHARQGSPANATAPNVSSSHRICLTLHRRSLPRRWTVSVSCSSYGGQRARARNPSFASGSPSSTMRSVATQRCSRPKLKRSS